MKVKLGDITKIRTGKLDANAADDDGVYPFFTCSREPLKINSYSYDCECVLVAGNGDLNVKYYNGKFDAYQRTYIIEAKQTDVLYMPYLYYFMEKYIVELRKLAIGGVIKYIKLGNLTDALIELPSYNQQRSLVERLEKVKSSIDKRNEQLEKLDELVKCRFVEMFGDCRSNPKLWATKKLEEIATVGSSKRVFVEELIDDGIPFYRGTEVGALAEGQQITPELFISESHYQALCEASGKPIKGDLLMPSICPDGRIWIVDSDSPFYFKDGRVLWVHDIHEQYNPVFLQYSLKERIITDYSSIATGTTFAELKIFTLKSCKIFDVPLSLQNTFAAFIQRIDKLRFVVETSHNHKHFTICGLVYLYANPRLNLGFA